MLKHIDPILVPDLLHVLAAMGHGDRLVLVDANFPADSVARRTTRGRVIHLSGVSVDAAARAICSVLPIDTFIDEPVVRMAMVDDPELIPDVQLAVRDAIASTGEPVAALGSLDRFAFYEAAAASYAVVATTDPRPYGCFLLTKGVIFAKPTATG